MALRSILDIDVNDAEFKAYKAKFDAYEAAVKKLPGDWAKAGAAIEGSRKSFDTLVAQLVAQNYQAKQYALAQKQADALTHSQADSWKMMANYTKDVVGNLIRTTENLIKWVGPIAIITGLLGAAGGLFGLDRLALSVSGQRRQTMGLGITTGQQNAFTLNYGRFVDTNAMLGNVATGLYNISSPQYQGLIGAGLSSQYLANPQNTAADVSVELLKHLPGMFPNAGKMDKGMIGAVAEGRGLTNILSTEDIVRYLRASPAERAAQERSYRKDVGALTVSLQDQLVYTNFITQLDRAGQQIETIFARGVVGLAKPLEDLSKAFSKWLAMFLESDKLKGWIDHLRAGIDWLAKQMSSPELEGEVNAFMRGLGDFIRQIKDWVAWFESKWGTLVKLNNWDFGGAANDIMNNIMGPSAPAPPSGMHPAPPGWARPRFDQKVPYRPLLTPQSLANGPTINLSKYMNRGKLWGPGGPGNMGKLWRPGSGRQTSVTSEEEFRRLSGSWRGGILFEENEPQARKAGVSTGAAGTDEFLGRPKPESNIVQSGVSMGGLINVSPEVAAHNWQMFHRPHNPYQDSGRRPRVEINSPTGGNTIMNNAQAAN